MANIVHLFLTVVNTGEQNLVAIVIREVKNLPSVSMRSGIHGFDGEEGRDKPTSPGQNT
jgi:hypothetical protein